VGIVLIEAMVLLAEHLEIPRSGSVRGTAHDTLRLSRRGKPRLRGQRCLTNLSCTWIRTPNLTLIVRSV
jgi:hypothetical protein